MNILIIGDKYQKRMKSKGCPAMIKNSRGSTIIENQYSLLRKLYPNAKIAYVTGFEHKKIENFLLKNSHIEIDLVYNEHYEEYSDCHSLSLVSKYLDEDLLVLFGYHEMKKNILNNLDAKNGSQIFIDNNYDFDMGCIIDNSSVKHISFDLPNKLSNMYFLCKKDSLVLKSYVESFKYRNYFLFEIINIMLDQGLIKIKPFFVSKNKTTIDRIKKHAKNIK